MNLNEMDKKLHHAQDNHTYLCEDHCVHYFLCFTSMCVVMKHSNTPNWSFMADDTIPHGEKGLEFPPDNNRKTFLRYIKVKKCHSIFHALIYIKNLLEVFLLYNDAI